MPDRGLIEQIAGTLGTNPGLVEKDWHVVRALSILADLDLGQTRLVFTGGTCLSKAWGLIQRFSEDVDFKADVPAGYGRPQRRELRRTIEAALIGPEFSLVEPAMVRDEGRFFMLKLDYGSVFPVLAGLRSHIQIEVSFRTPKLAPVSRSVGSFVAQAQDEAPEVSSIGCADPVETAAEKLSALAWRVLSHRNSPQDHDPSMMRHLHDLAALESRVADAPAFPDLVRETVALDAGRGHQDRPKDFGPLLQAMLTDIGRYKHWRGDYETFIREVSYATDDRRISFREALAALQRLVAGLHALVSVQEPIESYESLVIQERRPDSQEVAHVDQRKPPAL